MYDYGFCQRSLTCICLDGLINKIEYWFRFKLEHPIIFEIEPSCSIRLDALYNSGGLKSSIVSCVSICAEENLHKHFFFSSFPPSQSQKQIATEIEKKTDQILILHFIYFNIILGKTENWYRKQVSFSSDENG